VPTLAGVLKGAGFETAGFVSSIVLSRQSGLARGFDTYSDRFEVGADDARFLNSIQRRGDGPTAEAIGWLEGHHGGRAFVWLHLYDPHEPYEPPEPYASRYADRPYDGEVAWTDELVGRLTAALDRLGLTGDTALLVTSDHGEGLGQHGESVHGFFVYETTLRVPLLLRGPGIPAGARLRVTGRSIDLLPTALELVGVSPPAGSRLPGRSLLAVLRASEPREEPAYGESLLPLLHYGWSDLRSVRDGRWKYIQAPRPELYDLESDPGEEVNLVQREPARAEALHGALAPRLEAERAAPQASGVGMSAEMLEKLGALGYLGAGSLPPSARTGADPKDKIAEFKVLNRLMREGLQRLRKKDFAGSAERFAALLQHGVDSFEAHYYLARALSGLRRDREASAHYLRATERLPGFGAAWVGLARSRLAAGDAAGALDALTRGHAAAPQDAQILEAQAGVLRGLERPREAIAAYEAAVALAPGDALLKVELGEALRDAGDLVQAEQRLQEAVRLEPRHASYWNALGMVQGARGELAQSEASFRKALAGDATQAEYAYNLGLALMRQGRREEASPLFRRALELQPGFAAPRERLAEIRAR
jgi:tetratricopeptide (TPR) repeat protein